MFNNVPVTALIVSAALIVFFVSFASAASIASNALDVPDAVIAVDNIWIAPAQ